ncbi:MAG: biopolymer transporter ExbD [Cyanobacteria bacterium J06634_6]
MRLFSDDLEEEVSVNLLPMIDVIFAILSYFVISTLFLTRFDGLEVNLPSAETSNRQPEANFTVAIDAEGNVSLNGDSIQPAAIQGAIEQDIETGQTAVVTIRADEAAAHGQVVSVMDEVRQIEGAKLAIATKPDS